MTESSTKLSSLICFMQLSTNTDTVRISINNCWDWGLLIVDVLIPEDQVLIEKCTERTKNAHPLKDPLTRTTQKSSTSQTSLSNKVNTRNERSASLSSKYLRPNQASFHHNWAFSVIQYFTKCSIWSLKLLSSSPGRQYYHQFQVRGFLSHKYLLVFYLLNFPL